MISRMTGTPVFSDRTEYSVTTAESEARFREYVKAGTLLCARPIQH